MFRHYIELTLKSCILDACALAHSIDNTFRDPRLFEHSLSKLLGILRELWETESIKSEMKETSFLSDQCIAFIQELDHVDRESIAFRYPTDKKGVPTLPERIVFSPDVLETGMDHIQRELTRINAHISIARDLRDEYLAILRAELGYGL